MGGVCILDVTHVGSSNDDLLLLLIKEDLSVEGDGLFNAKVPLVESTLVGRAALHFGEKRFKCLNSVLLSVFSSLCLDGVELF